VAGENDQEKEWIYKAQEEIDKNTQASMSQATLEFSFGVSFQFTN
jgi:hypothetical protein